MGLAQSNSFPLNDCGYNTELSCQIPRPIGSPDEILHNFMFHTTDIEVFQVFQNLLTHDEGCAKSPARKSSISFGDYKPEVEDIQSRSDHNNTDCWSQTGENKYCSSLATENKEQFACKNEKHTTPLYFPNELQLQVHIYEFHKCPACKFCTMFDKDLLVHLRSHTERNQKKCDICGLFVQNVKEHTERVHAAHTFNSELYCTECKFQAKTNAELRAHQVNKHPSKDKIRCRICGEVFETKSTLMGHRKKEHMHTVAYCKNKTTGSCPFLSKLCWWRHDEESGNVNSGQNFNCYDCSETFSKKGDLMVHKKQKHKSTVRFCNDYLDDNCRFHDCYCWFRHEKAHEDNLHEEAREEEADDTSEEQVFQEVLEDLDPPIVNTPEGHVRKMQF